jgi:Ca2+-binding EF-hand superfamily protein
MSYLRSPFGSRANSPGVNRYVVYDRTTQQLDLYQEWGAKLASLTVEAGSAKRTKSGMVAPTYAVEFLYTADDGGTTPVAAKKLQLASASLAEAWAAVLNGGLVPEPLKRDEDPDAKAAWARNQAAVKVQGLARKKQATKKIEAVRQRKQEAKVSEASRKRGEAEQAGLDARSDLKSWRERTSSASEMKGAGSPEVMLKAAEPSPTPALPEGAEGAKAPDDEAGDGENAAAKGRPSAATTAPRSAKGAKDKAFEDAALARTEAEASFESRMAQRRVGRRDWLLELAVDVCGRKGRMGNDAWDRRYAVFDVGTQRLELYLERDPRRPATVLTVQVGSAKPKGAAFFGKKHRVEVAVKAVGESSGPATVLALLVEGKDLSKAWLGVLNGKPVPEALKRQEPPMVKVGAEQEDFAEKEPAVAWKPGDRIKASAETKKKAKASLEAPPPTKGFGRSGGARSKSAPRQGRQSGEEFYADFAGGSTAMRGVKGAAPGAHNASGSLNLAGDDEESVSISTAGVKSADAMPLSAAQFLQSKLFNCPRQHGLKLFKTPYDDYSCSRCKHVFPHSTWLQGCRECNFDTCRKCSETVGCWHGLSGETRPIQPFILREFSENPAYSKRNLWDNRRSKSEPRAASVANKPLTLKEVFQILDGDHDGTLTKNELMAGATKLGMTLDEASRLFDELDVNGDGELTKDESSFFSKIWLQYKNREPTKKNAKKLNVNQIFDLLDGDHDGTLSRDEMVAGAAKLDLSEEEAGKLFDAHDKDGSGVLTKEEASGWFGRFRPKKSDSGEGEKPKPTWTPKQIFALLDGDHDGTLSRAEIVAGAAKLDLSEEKAGELFDAHDKNGSGVLTKEEASGWFGRFRKKIDNKDDSSDERAKSEGSKKMKKLNVNQIFELLDGDHDGTLSRDEMVAGAAKLDLSEDEAGELFDAHDKDGSGVLTKQEAAGWFSRFRKKGVGNGAVVEESKEEKGSETVSALIVDDHMHAAKDEAI